MNRVKPGKTLKKSKEDVVSLLVLVPAQLGFQAIQKTLPTHIRWYLNIMENKLIQVELGWAVASQSE